MLKIRAEQLDALREAMQRNFEPNAVGHLRKYFPAETAALTDAELRAVVAEGRKHARSYGIEATNALQCFIDVRFVFGPSFDRDPELAWVAAPLHDPHLDAETRVEELVERAAQQLSRAARKGSG